MSEKNSYLLLTDNPPGRAIQLDGRAHFEVVGGHGTRADDEPRRAGGGEARGEGGLFLIELGNWEIWFLVNVGG